MSRLKNPSIPSFRENWDDVYGGTERGSSLVADHVAGFYWDDLRAPATGLNPPGAVSDPDRDSTTGHWLFDKNSTETIIAIFQFPHNWVEGTDINVHIHWIKEAISTVVWELEYKWYNVNGVYPASYTTLTTSSVTPHDFGAVSPPVNVPVISSFSTIAGTGKTISSTVEARISRLGGDGSDNYDQDARFAEVDIHILRSGHGSEGAFIRTLKESDIAGA